MSIVLKASNVNLHVIIVSIIFSLSLTLSVSLPVSHRLLAARSSHTLFSHFLISLFLSLFLHLSAPFTRLLIHVVIHSPDSHIPRNKVSPSLPSCLLKDEISRLLKSLLRLPTEIELIIFSFFFSFGLVSCFVTCRVTA